MRPLLCTACCLGLLLGAACAAEPPGRAVTSSAGEADRAGADEAEEASAAAADAPVAPRRLIKTVELVLEVRDTVAAADRAQELVRRAGGYVAGIAAQRVDGVMHYQLTLRVPVERLDEVSAELRRQATEVRREHMTTEDVSDRFVDLEARLRTLEATERELQALLGESRQRNQKAEDIMAIYRELTEIRTRVEQIEGQLAVLADRTTLSTLEVQLLPVEAARPLVQEGWRPGDTARSAFRGLLVALRVLADAAIVVLVGVLPVLLVVGLPVLALWRWRRRRARRAAGGP